MCVCYENGAERCLYFGERTDELNIENAQDNVELIILGAFHLVMNNTIFDLLTAHALISTPCCILSQKYMTVDRKYVKNSTKMHEN